MKSHHKFIDQEFAWAPDEKTIFVLWGFCLFSDFSWQPYTAPPNEICAICFPSRPIAHPPPPSSPFSISRAIDCEVAGGDRDDLRNKLSAEGALPNIGYEIFCLQDIIGFLLLRGPRHWIINPSPRIYISPDLTKDNIRSCEWICNKTNKQDHLRMNDSTGLK